MGGVSLFHSDENYFANPHLKTRSRYRICIFFFVVVVFCSLVLSLFFFWNWNLSLGFLRILPPAFHIHKFTTRHRFFRGFFSPWIRAIPPVRPPIPRSIQINLTRSIKIHQESIKNPFLIYIYIYMYMCASSVCCHLSAGGSTTTESTGNVPRPQLADSRSILGRFSADSRPILGRVDSRRCRAPALCNYPASSHLHER